MLALLLGLIALAIAILYASAYDKIANEIRDIRIKCIGPTISSYQSENNTTIIPQITSSDQNDQNDLEDDPSLEWEDLQLQLPEKSADYYANANYTENFSNEDIIEQF